MAGGGLTEIQPSSGGTAAPPDGLLGWLLDGDVAVQYQVERDLRGADRPDLQARIATEGDGARLLAARRPDGQWGRGFYQPKWTCTHYTLLELANLGLPGDNPDCAASVRVVLDSERGPDGGIYPAGGRACDVCINGMFLRYASWFRAPEGALDGVVGFVLAQRMPDGGFNCRSNRSARPPVHASSVHSTVSVLEGLTGYLAAGFAFRREDCRDALATAVECLLERRLYLSRRTGEPIHREFTRLHHPTRWYFDVLRGLDALRGAGVPDDPRLDPALELLAGLRRPDGRWSAGRSYPGQTHLEYPRGGTGNRWVTLAALRVQRAYPRRTT